MSDFFHGIRFQPHSDTLFSAPAPNYTAIGLVATADDADATAFPLHKAVLLKSYGAAVRAATGSGGTLKTTLDLINSLGFFPPVMVVRVPENSDATAQAEAVAEGLPILGNASAEYDLSPKILGAPGLDRDATVVEALDELAEALNAYAYVTLPAADEAEALAAIPAYRSRRMMAIWPDFSQDQQVVSAVPLALGLRSWIDARIGPHKTLSNVVIPSEAMNGISALVDWQGRDSSANRLNQANITTLIRREGFRFWGNRNCSSGDAWQFESDIRMSDVLKGIVEANQFDTLDHPMSQAMIDNRLALINADIQTLVKRGWLIGGRAWIDPGQNEAEVLANGGLRVDYEFTVPKPGEQLVLTESITDHYLLQVLPQWITVES